MRVHTILEFLCVLMILIFIILEFLSCHISCVLKVELIEVLHYFLFKYFLFSLHKILRHQIITIYVLEL